MQNKTIKTLPVISLGVLALFIILYMTPLFAQTGINNPRANPTPRIVRPMVPLDPVTLQAEGIKIQLWGIKAAHTSETPLELSALTFVENTIGNQPVNCRIENKKVYPPTARCSVHTNEDLALALLQEGYAVIDRHQTYNSVFASSYEDAQDSARKKHIGIWDFVQNKNTEKLIPSWLEPYMPSLVPLSLVFGPIIGLLLIALATRRGFAKILRRQAMEYQETREKEEGLFKREKLVLASALEGELSENKIKIEAFLTIYHSILNELLQEDIMPKYQKGGDLIHKYPTLNRTVFEGSITKLSALDMHMASTLSKLYTHIHAEPEYKTIESNLPLDEVIEMVRDVIKVADSIIPQIDYAVEQLQTTMQQLLETGKKPKKTA